MVPEANTFRPKILVSLCDARNTRKSEREREREMTVFVSGHDRCFSLSRFLQSHDTGTIVLFPTSLCGGGLALQPPVVAVRALWIRSLQLTAVQFRAESSAAGLVKVFVQMFRVCAIHFFLA